MDITNQWPRRTNNVNLNEKGIADAQYEAIAVITISGHHNHLKPLSMLPQSVKP